MRGLENYETVKERKVRFYNDHPTGAVHVELTSPPEQAQTFVVIHASVWRDAQDMRAGHGPDSQGLSLSVAGGKGADRDAWMENCEESAVGRALDNLGYHSGTCSREEMQKQQAHAEQAPAKKAPAKKGNPAVEKEKLQRKFFAVARGKGMDDETIKAFIFDTFAVDSTSKLTEDDLTEAIETIAGMEGK